MNQKLTEGNIQNKASSVRSNQIFLKSLKTAWEAIEGHHWEMRIIKLHLIKIIPHHRTETVELNITGWNKL